MLNLGNYLGRDYLLKITVFIYNIFLISLYTSALTYSSSLYLRKKYPFHLCISVLFLFYIFDDTIIYMSEFLSSFSHYYDLQFLNVPAFKTVIMMATGTCLIFIHYYILDKKISFIDWCIFILLAVSIIFTPMISQDALMVWSYYLPYQILTLYLGFTGILYLKNNSYLIEKYPNIKGYKSLLILTIIFSFLIIIEDTIVIFSFDIYTHISLKINNRSLSEDILNIIYAVSAIRYFSKQFNNSMIVKPAFKKDSPDDLELINKTKISNYVFYQFSERYNLTIREQDILEVLLQNKNNQEISNELVISIGTVKSHIHNIFQKVNVTKRSMLIRVYEEFSAENSSIEKY